MPSLPPLVMTTADSEGTLKYMRQDKIHEKSVTEQFCCRELGSEYLDDVPNIPPFSFISTMG